MHHSAQIGVFQHAFSLFEQVCKRTLVQFWRMPYNVSYFVDFIKGFADELIKDAPGARSPPKRKKPTVSTPLDFRNKYSVIALVGPLDKVTEQNDISTSIVLMIAYAAQKVQRFWYFFREKLWEFPAEKRGTSQEYLKTYAFGGLCRQLLPYAIHF